MTSYQISYLSDLSLFNSGSFGKVYKGIYSHTNGLKVQIAMKSVSKMYYVKNNIINKPFVERDVFNVLNNCEHFVKLLFTFQDDLCLYFVMDFVNGVTIEQIINNFQKVKQEQFFRIVQQLFIGVNYLHSKGIIHRDIHPGNLIITTGSRNVLKIIDYGESTYIDSIGIKVATGYARAPEMFTGIYSYGVDYWSVGVTLYEISERKAFNIYNYSLNKQRFKKKNVHLLRSLLCFDVNLRILNYHKLVNSFNYTDDIFNIRNFKSHKVFSERKI